MRIRIRIQQLKLMRIHADPDTDPKPCCGLSEIREKYIKKVLRIDIDIDVYNRY